MNMSLRNKINLSFVLSIIVVTLIVATISTNTTRNVVENTISERAETAANTAENIFEDWINTRARILSSIIRILNEFELQDYLIQAREAGDFDEVYFGTQNGEMLRSRPERNIPGYDPRNRPWYKDAVKAEKLITTSAYRDATTNELMVTIAQPVYKENRLIGVIGADILIDDLNKKLSNLNIGKGAYFSLIDGINGLFIVHPEPSLLLKPTSSIFKEMTLSFIELLALNEKVTYFKNKEDEYLVFVKKIPNTSLFLEMFMEYDAEYSDYKNSTYKLSLTVVIITLIILPAMSFLLKHLFRDIGLISKALKDIASGEGDLTKIIEPHSRDEIGELAINFNTYVRNMHTLIMRLKNICQLLSSQSQITASQAEERSVRITMQQDEINMVATAVNEVAAATQKIANNSENTAKYSAEVVSATTYGSKLVDQTQQSIHFLETEIQTATTVIQELEQNGNQISTILSTIQNIADQTNLLALNAAIEAARAGEQGRGFAVVADEVRVLSQRTHSSTKEIQTMIESLQTSTSKAVDIMKNSQTWAETSVNNSDSASSSLIQIQKNIISISDMAVQIASAAEEQTSVTSEITRSMEGIKDVSNDFAQEAQEAANQAAELSNLSVVLQQEINRFKL